ncbi:MAG: RIP metalloprotease RseP [Bdellovibrionales bacterium]|nr:RIP metalloprotease RseP [Bdellovibrionales bacterium]
MEYILGFALLLGVLIFIHEFGHFIVAKACGIRVEAFSIGMGKKFVKFTRGETEYALSLLPLGGYVKLLGQDPREEVPVELLHRSFREKPLWKRAAVVLAGPVFNAALAVAVFVALMAHGVPVQAPTFVRVLPGSKAEQAGLRSGDHVVSVQREGDATQPMRELADLESAIADSVARPLSLNILRTDKTGATERVSFQVIPELGSERDSTSGVVRDRGTIPGVEYRESGSVAQVDSKSWAGARHLPTWIWIEELRYAVDGIEKVEKIESYSQLEDAWSNAVAALGKRETGKVEVRGRKVNLGENKAPDDTESYSLAWTSRREAMPPIEGAGLHSAELALTEVKAGSPAEKLGLKSGDRIVRINDIDVYSFQSFRNLIQKLAAEGHELKLAWKRDGKAMESSVKPELVAMRDPLTEAKKNQFQIGAMFIPTQAPPPEATLKGEGAWDTFTLGVNRTYKLTVSMLESFYLLATGEISPKTLGGPILIGKIAGESFRAGPVPFFRMMAFISMNLCILNLLPVPVLDGGHLLLYCIEAVRRKPLSIRVVEVWTTTGFFLLMGLIAVVFFNDLSRLGLFKIFKL